MKKIAFKQTFRKGDTQNFMSPTFKFNSNKTESKNFSAKPPRSTKLRIFSVLHPLYIPIKLTKEKDFIYSCKVEYISFF